MVCQAVWTRLTPGFQQIPQFTDITGGMAVFQTEVREAPLGTALGGAGEQVVQIVRTQGDGGVGFGHVVVSHLQSPKQMARTDCSGGRW
jgi:hypothetical protein